MGQKHGGILLTAELRGCLLISSSVELLITFVPGAAAVPVVCGLYVISSAPPALFASCKTSPPF